MTDSMGMTLFFCYGNSWTANIAGVYLRTDLKVSSHPWTEGDILLRRFFLTELKIATWNFHPDNMVREGDSSPAANPDNGTLIAVKRIHTEGFLGYEHWLLLCTSFLDALSGYYSSVSFFVILVRLWHSGYWDYCF